MYSHDVCKYFRILKVTTSFVETNKPKRIVYWIAAIMYGVVPLLQKNGFYAIDLL